MAVPVFLTDGKTAIDFVDGKLPVDVTGITVNASSDMNLDTVNAAVTLNVAVTNTPDVTGNVAISGTPDVTGNVTVSGTPDVTGNVTVSGTPDVTGNVTVGNFPASQTIDGEVQIVPSLDSGIVDAFGRQRVSELITMFSSSLTKDGGGWDWDIELSGNTGNIEYGWDNWTSSFPMTVNDTHNAAVVRQSFRRFHYQPGKSQLTIMSHVLGAGEVGVTKTIGYGDENNGIFLQSIDNVLGFTIRTNTTNNAVDTFVAQANWNLDKLDGTGVSGYTLNVAKANILFIDFEWLGVGRVRCGFVIDGKVIYAHAFNNANNLEGVYMRHPNLPLRYELTCNGDQAANSTLTQICSMVASEGGMTPIGNPRTAHTTANVAVAAGDEPTVILGIRLSNTNQDNQILLKGAAIYNDVDNSAVEYQLIMAPTVNGAFAGSWEVGNGTTVEFITGNGAQTVNDGRLLVTDYATTRSAGTIGEESRPELGYTINGVPIELYLCARRVRGSGVVNGALNWIDLR